MKKILVGIIDNGMRLSRTSWAVSMAQACLTVFREYRVTLASISYPYCAGAMNKISNSFLNSDCEEMIIIDTDIIFTPDDIRNLMEHDEPLVFGLYPRKELGLVYPTIPLDEKANPFDCEENLCEVAATARGFMRVNKSVFAALSACVNSYIDPDTRIQSFEFWKTLPGDHSEDFNFCNTWRSLGGKILIDKRICAKHEGSVVYPINGTF